MVCKAAASQTNHSTLLTMLALTPICLYYALNSASTSGTLHIVDHVVIKV